MSEWDKLKKLYLDDHLAKPLEQTSRRVSALAKIEDMLYNIDVFDATECKSFFQNTDKETLRNRLEAIKGTALNGAEQSVVTGLYKFLPSA